VNEVGHVAQPGERGKEFPRKEGVDEAWNQCYEIGHILPKKKIGRFRYKTLIFMTKIDLGQEKRHFRRK
jgi:hypothetical protein